MTDGSAEMYVDRLIREAMERGELDDLPGTGKPIPGAGKADDQWWWFRRWVQRNGIDPGSPPGGISPTALRRGSGFRR
ncbi:MAG: DUF1992 domain-containing protein [Actinobacteria bacterium]|nr:DUF1992 domain-containing protein [Actinomycetota bacterium]